MPGGLALGLGAACECERKMTDEVERDHPQSRRAHETRGMEDLCEGTKSPFPLRMGGARRESGDWGLEGRHSGMALEVHAEKSTRQL